MTGHAVVIAGGGPTGLMLAGELALARVDVAIVERRASQDLAGSRAGGLHARTIEAFDQRGIADRFLAEGQTAQVAAFAGTTLDISDFPTRHPYALGLWQNQIERILADWVGELAVTFCRGREVTGFAQDDAGVDVELSEGHSLRAEYLVGCDGGRSVVRKAAGIEFPGWDPTTSSLIAEVVPNVQTGQLPGESSARLVQADELGNGVAQSLGAFVRMAKRDLRHRGAQHARSDRVALGMVGIEEAVRRRLVDHLGELPAQVHRILHTGVETLSAVRGMHVCGVARQ